MFFNTLHFALKFRSFPVLVESNVAVRSLIRTDGFPKHKVPNNLSISLMSYQDFIDIGALHEKNKSWLDPWTVTEPVGYECPIMSFAGIKNMFSSNVDKCLKRMCEDKDYYFKICLDDVLCGFISVNEVSRNSLCSAQVGYWIDKSFAGRNIMTVALAMITDFCFEFLNLHRVEINICTNNVSSLRLMDKLGFRFEGTKEKYLFVNNNWADHLSFALTVEDLSCGGVLAKYENSCF